MEAIVTAAAPAGAYLNRRATLARLVPAWWLWRWRLYWHSRITRSSSAPPGCLLDRPPVWQAWLVAVWLAGELAWPLTPRPSSSRWRCGLPFRPPPRSPGPSQRLPRRDHVRGSYTARPVARGRYGSGRVDRHPVASRGFTFYFDEWDFITTAPDWNVASLLEPHNMHPAMLPRLIYA